MAGDVTRAGGPPAPDAGIESGAARRRRSAAGYRLPLIVLLVGLAATAALTSISASLYSRNERRLLRLRVHDAGLALSAAAGAIETPLASFVALADATNGNPQRLRTFIAPYLLTGASRTFVSVSLWKASAPQQPAEVFGSAPQLVASGRQAAEFIAQAFATHRLQVIGLLGGPAPRLGYALTGVRMPGPFVAYGESALPANRYAAQQAGSAFTDLNYAIYLGPRPSAATLLLTSARRLPLSGQRDRETFPFGSSSLTLVMSAQHPLAGSLPNRLPLGIGIAGALLSLGVALLTSRLSDRRHHAERLAGELALTAEENRRLYGEQRGIAQTLQHALLPDALPRIRGLDTAALYEAGVRGVEIGGDWYDLLPAGDERLLLVVGDVSGRGLRAAATMASLRHAIHAYAAQNDAPDEILSKLSRLLSVRDSGQLATILCVLVDLEAQTLCVTSAGHLPPLLVGEGSASFLECPVGLPVGVDREPTYESVTQRIPAGATLIAYTDGLVERRGETIDAGLERLREAARDQQGTLAEVLSRLLEEVRGQEAEDDTAIVAIRWVVSEAGAGGPISATGQATG